MDRRFRKFMNRHIRASGGVIDITKNDNLVKEFHEQLELEYGSKEVSYENQLLDLFGDKKIKKKDN